MLTSRGPLVLWQKPHLLNRIYTPHCLVSPLEFVPMNSTAPTFFFLCWIWKSRARFGCCLSIRLVLHQKFCLVLNVSQTGFFMNHILTWGVLFQKNCGSQIPGFKMMKCTWFFTILTARLCIFYLSNIVQQYWTENVMRIFSYVT
jgi:hypothetical protein